MRRFEPTPEQLAVIEHRGSHALVFAGPGTGKTETLARRFASLVVDDRIDPSSILVLTFSRRAAEQMLERIVQRLRERSGKELAVSELFVRTFHGFCARLLDGDGPRFRERNLLTPVKERLLWRRVATRVPLSSFEPEVSTSPAFAADALNLIAQLKGQGLGSEDLAAADEPRLGDLAALYRELDADRTRLQLSDFRDLVKDALAALDRPDSPASRWLRARGGFRHILVDEFQDSDKLQLRLLAQLAGEDRRRPDPVPEICFVGDFNQSIYRFRGAAPENIAEVREAFACRELELHTNRRSAQAVLDVANATPNLKAESLTNAEDRALAGSVRLVRPPTPTQEVETVCDVVGDRLSAGTPPREIAVLLRVAEPYQSLIIAGLDARGIPVAARPSAGFLEDPAVGAVLTAIRLTGALDDENLWTRLLTNPLIGFGAVSVRVAFDRARRAKITNAFVALADAPPVGRILFADFLKRWRRVENAAQTANAAALVALIAREFDLLRPVLERSTPPGWDARSSPARLGALLEAARDLQAVSRALGDGRVAPAGFVDNIEEIAGLLADPTEAPAADSEGVRVMSIHAAKGLEFDIVILPRAIDGVMPQRGRGHALLSAAALRALRRRSTTMFADPQEAFLEECSLWYVALTRARREVLIMAAQADDDDIELPLSRFAHGIEVMPGAALCLNVSAQSDAVGVRPLRTPSPVAQDRSPITHLVHHLSPSSVETYLACPRRFFYKEVLRLAPEGDEEGALLGDLLHRALAAFHDEERDFADTTDLEVKTFRWREALRAHVDSAAPVVAARQGIPATSSFMRYEIALAHRYLNNYAERLAVETRSAPFQVLACEQTFQAQIDGVALSGRADRVDRLVAGGLAIRDYKSGKSKPKSATAIRTALERVAAGELLAGDAPDGLSLQTLLYVPGAQALFGEHVARLEYIYLRGKGDGSSIETDTVTIVDGVAPADTKADAYLTRSEVERAQSEIAAAVAHALADGRLSAFATALSEDTCRYCDFVRACPGARTVTP